MPGIPADAAREAPLELHADEAEARSPEPGAAMAQRVSALQAYLARCCPPDCTG
ncbi:hypothetical protein [Streptomyces sp. NBC_01618]|uniref:hypothetical protein n=1 Tax=Streptomyces sp. NBC_01618 TaxID=2975900 RepID=UPI00386D5BDC|nr:hypothetical protein OH735_19780 [Streptomyces sp. NBC_01618]